MSNGRLEGQRARTTSSEAADEFIFPIRSAMSIDSTPLSAPLNQQNHTQASDFTAQPKPAASEFAHVTTRHQHFENEQGHHVIMGVHGNEGLQQCEDEPIHIPGSIQSFGVLLALRREDENFAVRVVSENSQTILGISPQKLFLLKCFTELLSEEQKDVFLDHVNYVEMGSEDLLLSGPDVFTLFLKPNKDQSAVTYWCAMHRSPANEDFIICEFEFENDTLNPLVTPLETSESPASTLATNPSEIAIEESTRSMAKPLRMLAVARKLRGEAAAMEAFNVMYQVNEQLGSAEDLQTFLKIAIGVIKELTGFHRVMIYQFDEAWNGKVVAELVDPQATKDFYHGLHFPASDIPSQARDLYKLNKVRLLYDRDAITSRLVCRTQEDLKRPIDMTHAYLRAMSPIHVKYLRNMAVKASMSISITVFNELWGLVSCHSYGNRGSRCSFPIRKMCRLVGETLSRNIERLSYAMRLHARKLINTVPTEENPTGYIIASSNDLLRLFDADFGLVAIRDETKILGALEDTQEALAIHEYLKVKRFLSVTLSQDIRSDFPDFKYAKGLKIIAGLLVVPLSSGGRDFIVFLRRGHTQTVSWAGNPYEKVIRSGTNGYLEPRKSFQTWSETLSGKSRQWTEDQIETAAVLCLVYGKFIEVWRQKETAVHNSQLTNLLLSNASHEVRTPLNAIINYLEIAMEGSLDSETRENLARSHSASKSLVYVINDLLDLTRTENGLELVNNEEEFDLRSVIREACGAFEADAERKSLKINIEDSIELPYMVIGDKARVHQALTNVTANAVKHTTSGAIRIENNVLMMDSERVEVEVSVEDTGSGMPPEQLATLFRELEQVQTDEDGQTDSLVSINSSTQKPADSHSYSKEPRSIPPSGKRTLGLGLAVVARIIKNMNGQMRVKSHVGEGTKFTLQFSFRLGTNELQRPSSLADINACEEDSATARGSPRAASLPSLMTSREVTLVRSPRGRLTSHPLWNGQTSDESLNSLTSARSATSNRSAKSEIYRLVDSKSFENQNYRDEASPFMGSGRINPPSIEASGSGAALVSIGIEGSAVPMSAVSAHRETNDLGLSHRLQLNPEQSRKSLQKRGCMNILVAEDDPINSKIFQKRLERSGHSIRLTRNGQDCVNVFAAEGHDYDVVLMDMQMPICDGQEATKIIRDQEKSQETISKRHLANGRIPIFAVSASLLETNHRHYSDSGFDGWILKPIFFDRMEELLQGISNALVRNMNIYETGDWERGGWFTCATSEHNEL